MITLLATMALVAETPMAIRTRAFPGLNEGGMEVGCMVMTSGHMLFGPEGFGGYSALHLDRDASKLILLSDRNHILTLPVTFDDSGRVESFGTATQWPIERARAVPRGRDTEALVPWESGYLISRERINDLIRIEAGQFSYDVVDVTVSLDGLEPLEPNGGYEAATRVRDGLVLAIPETSDDAGTAGIVLWDGGEPRIAARYRTEEAFSVTDIFADDASGRLFVLERAFDRSRGPRAKVSVVSLGAIMEAEPTDIIAGEELGRLTFLQGADNMEGMTMVRTADGADALMLVSDDNFSDLQRTVLMTLKLTPGCPLTP